MAKSVVITLTVQASTLFNLLNPTPIQIGACCSLSDDNGGSGSPIENFTSTVFIDKNVKWKGETPDKGFSIAIDSIAYDSKGKDVDFFDVSIIPGSGGRSGNANANVKKDDSLKGKLDVYTLNFKVYDSGNNFKSFPIDPKLVINP
ncbi:hypothetical protein [Flavobacterium frigoris]|uniref:Uncharacterized protein n=1 Tax=Flavobacterium frigoris TaxID=229204 RepID=A0A1H9JTY6_FLAFI|nr:hypothetical protein [Flavobacterium frigoris]SEQ90214.1 hypothetical protein SAMN05444355_10555 [Flavobacterium frigoris]